MQEVYVNGSAIGWPQVKQIIGAYQGAYVQFLGVGLLADGESMVLGFDYFGNPIIPEIETDSEVSFTIEEAEWSEFYLEDDLLLEVYNTDA